MCAKCDGLLKKMWLNSKKLIKKEKDCAFFLFCPSSCLTEKFLDAVKLTKNLFISVAYNKNNHKHPAPSNDIFKQLRIRKLPYAVHYYYSASDIENFKSGEIFKELSKERPLFSFFLSKKSDSVQDTVTEEDKKAVYEIIIKERYWLTYPSIPFAIWFIGKRTDENKKNSPLQL